MKVESGVWTKKKAWNRYLILEEISQKMDANPCISRIRLSLYIIYKCTITQYAFCTLVFTEDQGGAVSPDSI